MSYSDIFSHIVAYLEPRLTLAYSEPCHIQNFGIFRTQDIFRTLSKPIMACSEGCAIPTYWEPYSELCHIQNFCIFRTQRYNQNTVYLGIFRHGHSGIFNYDSLIILNFFFHFNLTYLSKFTKTYLFDYNGINFSAWWVYVNNMRFLKIVL